MKPIEYPEVCPYCGEKVSYRYDGISEYCFCDNPNCAGRLINRLEHFFGKKGLDIKGLSKATFEKLIDWGWVNSIEDVFKLTQYKDEWVQKPGFGEKSVNNILNAIESGKTCEMSKFIAGLGIPLVGSSYAKVITQNMRTWDEFRDAVKSNFNFMQWDGFGPQVSDSLLHFDYTEADNLYINYLNIDNSLYHSTGNTTTSDTLKNITFVITGKLTTYKNREALVSDIEAHGGKVANSISKNTSYLINNDINSTSSKNVAAKKLNIPIITEETFKQLMNGEILYIGTTSTVELTCMMPA
jgi:DNA ligase (NAD+)